MAKLAKLLEGVQEHLESSEPVLASVEGTYETKKMGSDWIRKGALVATDRRVVFFAKKIGGYDLESFPYNNISSVEMSKGMMGHRISFHATGNEVSMKWINDGESLKSVVDEIKTRHHATSPSAAPSVVEPDVMDQIKRLGISGTPRCSRSKSSRRRRRSY